MNRIGKSISIIAYLVLCISMLASCSNNEHVDIGNTGGNTSVDISTDVNVDVYINKLSDIKNVIYKSDNIDELEDIEVDNVGKVVFISVCDGKDRALVYTGIGDTIQEAIDNASTKAESALAHGLDPLWVKVDALNYYVYASTDELLDLICEYRHEFFRYGIAFDNKYETALLEAELNGHKIYAYDDGKIDLEYLNNYLRKSNRDALDELPDDLILFQTKGWISDENSNVYELSDLGLKYGRREIDSIDSEYAKYLITNASDYLIRQIKGNGQFIYGYYPRFDNEIENYNIVRHVSTIWSLLCRYRMEPSIEIKEKIDSTIEYAITQVLYEDNDTAYLYEAKSDEIKLGGCGIAVVALTEYMDIFGSNEYKELAEQLGNGILKLMNQENGTYYHVLNGDFTKKEEFRTIYYDGEATFALCKLYSLTGDIKWLNAAEAAIGNFIENNYERYKDHWIAYSLNEITKHITDNVDYYSFALRNIQSNLDVIYERDTTYHTYLEMLMAGYETYLRMVENNIELDWFELDGLVETIYARADRMLNGYFYPEYVMYMENPQNTLYTFMVRHDGYRVRIDDVQHNIGGYYLYWKNYDNLVKHGILKYTESK